MTGRTPIGCPQHRVRRHLRRDETTASLPVVYSGRGPRGRRFSFPMHERTAPKARDPGGAQSMPDDPRTQVTQLLQSLGSVQNAAEQLLPLVYDELRAIAGARMAQERPGHTLQATALVSEAYVRLVGIDRMEWQNRAQFFAVAATAMRRVLIDHARKRDSEKRGGGRAATTLTTVDLSEDHDAASVLALDEALNTLEEEDPRAARVVSLRFFAGLSVADTAAALDISERTVMREWTYARARLFELMEGEKQEED